LGSYFFIRDSLFHAPANVIRDFPQFPAVHAYPELLRLIREKL
jgi:hypothetical protein